MNAKRIITLVAIATLMGASPLALAGKYVNGYTKKDGTYVSGYYKSDANSVRYDNNSSQSNGGTERDEYSSPAATNKGNSSWGYSDNDGDGVSNAYDRSPNKKSEY